MKKREEFKKIMREDIVIALSTSVNDIPNSRFVNFYYSPTTKLLYFATFKDNDKVFEIEKNNKVSILTIPNKDTVSHIKAGGIVRESKLSMSDFLDKIVKKVPVYKSIVNTFGIDVFKVYEIDLQEITLVTDIGSLSK